MSRIGYQPIKIPGTVKVTLEEGRISLFGPKGTLPIAFDKGKLSLELKNETLYLTAKNKDRKTRALHGTIRTLIFNAIKGVTEGFSKTLELIGVGFRAEVAPDGELSVSIGFSHPVKFKAPEGITFAVSENNKIAILGQDKQLVGLVASLIRKVKPAEPYKGKGIRYQGEKIRKKAGKAAKAVGMAPVPK